MSVFRMLSLANVLTRAVSQRIGTPYFILSMHNSSNLSVAFFRFLSAGKLNKKDRDNLEKQTI
jgi:hypothetical protein